MTTFNTGNPIGSTDSRDRLDNAENADILENSTSLRYHADRLGTVRKTRYGMQKEHDDQIAAHEVEHDSQIAAHEVEHDYQMQSFENDFDSRLAGMAFTRVGTFTAGATLTDMRQTLLWEVSQGGDGHEYGWTGSFPKIASAGSSPSPVSSGGWVDRTDERLRSEYTQSHQYTLVGYVQGINLDGITDNRNAIYATTGSVFIPEGMTVKCNLLPTDDVRKFIGYGSISSTDPWGNTHILSVKDMYSSQSVSDKGKIFEAIHTKTQKNIGIIGDSITDGADATGWTANPTDGSGNLSSTSHDHSLNGGAVSWFRTFTNNINYIANPAYSYSTAYLKPCNISSSGKRLADGWGYSNFDYGFFQNAAYGNKAPDVLYIAFGYNDNSYTDSTAEMLAYRDALDALICKAKGYGCSVALVTINTNDSDRKAQEISVKESAAKKYGITFYDLSVYLDKYRRSAFELASSMWLDTDLTWDMTHPKAQTHQFIGSAMTHAVAKEFLISAGDGVNHKPLTGTDFQNKTYPSNAVKPVTQSMLSGGYLTELDGWAVISPSENITISYPVWCEDPLLSCVIFEPFHPTYTVSSYSHSAGIILNDRRNSKTSYTLASSKFPNFTKWLTSRISNLNYGLNWIDIIYDGAPSTVYAPALLFRKSNNLASIAKSSRSIPAGGTQPISLYGVRKSLLKSSYNAVDGLDYLVDETNSENFDSLAWFNISGGIGAALVTSSKTGEGVQITKASATTVTVGLIGGSAVTATGTFTSGFSVAINPEPSGATTILRIGIYDDTNTLVLNTTVSPPNGVGGAISVYNSSASSMVISTSGSYGYLA